MTDSVKTIIIFPLIGLLIFIFEFLARKDFLREELSRKLLHLIIGIIASFSPFIFEEKLFPLSFGIISLIFNAISHKFGILKKIDPATRKSFGTVYFSLSFTILIFLFWDEKLIILISFFLFAIGDFFAGISEFLFRKRIVLDITNEPKTFQGAISNFIVTIIFYYLIYYLFNNEIQILISPNHFLLLCLLTAILSTFVEILSIKGTDNLFLPLFLAVFTYINLKTPQYFYELLIGFLLGVLIAIISLKLKILSKSGAITTIILAMFIYGLGNWKWTLPIFGFFILSSALSKISEKFTDKKSVIKAEKGSQRDMGQVIANGGIPLLIILLNYFFENSAWYLIFLVAIAVHTSDTWSTEGGTAFARGAYMITTFKKIKCGESGGVSLIGSIFGILGSATIIIIGNYFVTLNFKTFFSLVALGFIGNIIDSLIGATIQAKYKCNVCLKETEKKKHCNVETSLIKGNKFINNDFVNYSSALITTIIGAAIFL